jgi:predicted transcriptional regulator
MQDDINPGGNVNVALGQSRKRQLDALANRLNRKPTALAREFIVASMDRLIKPTKTKP